MSDEQEQAPTETTLATSQGTAAMVARETALIQSRFVMAYKRPRNIHDVRQDLLKTCERPRFAEKAWYSRPVGREKNEETGEWEEKVAEGLSVRFAEAAALSMGNVDTYDEVVVDNDDYREIRVTALDLEKNTSYSRIVHVAKVIERKKLGRGQVPIGKRTNSYGDQVFLVRGNDDQLRTKELAEIAKAQRTLVLKLIPSDIKDECLDRVRAVVEKGIKDDPQAALLALVDAFGKLGVKASELTTYVGGRALDALGPPDIMHLRGVFSAVSQGMVTWHDVMDASPYVSTEEKSDTQKATADKIRAEAERAKKKAQERAAAPKKPPQQPEVVEERQPGEDAD